MKMKMFSVYDSKVEAFLQPFFMRTAAAALSAFTDLVNDSSTMFAKHPGDYTLFMLGDWEDETALFSPQTAPVNLALGQTLVREQILAARPEREGNSSAVVN